MSGKSVYTCETCFKRGEVNVKDLDWDGYPCLPEDFWDRDTCRSCYDLFYSRPPRNETVGGTGWLPSIWKSELSDAACATDVLSALIDRIALRSPALGS